MLTSTSRPPNVSIAVLHERGARRPSRRCRRCSRPPRRPPRRSRRRRRCAGRVGAACRRAATPRSLTTTCAPSRANASACSRPMPRPAPVTMTTRPSAQHGWVPYRRAVRGHDVRDRPDDRHGRVRARRRGPRLVRRSTSPSTRTSRRVARTPPPTGDAELARGVQAHARSVRRARDGGRGHRATRRRHRASASSRSASRS